MNIIELLLLDGLTNTEAEVTAENIKNRHRDIYIDYKGDIKLTEFANES